MTYQVDISNAPLKGLQSQLRDSFKNQMGASLLGRITAIVPFFPFSKAEQAVVAHGFLLNATDKIRAPLDLSQDKLIGDLNLQTLNDGQLCSVLAEKAYDPELGVRSLDRAVTDEILVRLVNSYLEGRQEVETIRESHRSSGKVQRPLRHEWR